MKTMAGCAAVAAGFLATTAFAGVVINVDVIAREGAIAPGSGGLIFDTLNAPFTDGLGRLGFTGGLTGGSSTNFVWYDGQVVWLNSDALPTVLSGAEGTMGVSDTGGFIYSPSTDGDDSVWTDAGLLLKEDDAAPGIPGMLVSFASRPQMLPNGSASFVGGWTDTPGGSTDARVLWQVTGEGGISVVLKSGDVVDGDTIDFPAGVAFNYEFSDDGAHHIHVLVMDTGSSLDDGAVYVDGTLVVREGQPINELEAWDNFDIVSINNDGDYLFTGDTDGDTATDEFIAINGVIAVREGDVIDGVTLTGATLRAASLNDDGNVVHVWGVAGGDEVMFYGSMDNLGASTRLLATDDFVDTDGDRLADAQIVDFNASAVVGPGVELAEDGTVSIEVDLLELETEIETEAIIRLTLDSDCVGDFDNDGSVGIGDLLQLLGAWGLCKGCDEDLDGTGTVGVSDLLLLLGLWGDC